MSKWFKLRYWRWLWKHRISDRDKMGFAVFAGILLAIGGWLTAFSLTRPEASSAFITTERLVTVVHKTPGGMTTEVATVTDTLVETGATQIVTVMRNGREVTLRVPAETVTSLETVKVNGKTIVRTRTDTIINTQTNTQTNTETQTVDRTVTQTQTVTQQETGDPGRVTITQTTTETNDVPGPTTTVTNTDTVTHTETETQTNTDTVTVTETVTEPAP